LKTIGLNKLHIQPWIRVKLFKLNEMNLLIYLSLKGIPVKLITSKLKKKLLNWSLMMRVLIYVGKNQMEMEIEIFLT